MGPKVSYTPRDGNGFSKLNGSLIDLNLVSARFKLIFSNSSGPEPGTKQGEQTHSEAKTVTIPSPCHLQNNRFPDNNDILDQFTPSD